MRSACFVSFAEFMVHGGVIFVAGGRFPFSPIKSHSPSDEYISLIVSLACIFSAKIAIVRMANIVCFLQESRLYRG